MEHADTINYLIELRKLNIITLNNYIKLINITDNIEKALIQKINDLHENINFINSLFKDAMANYYNISHNMIS